MASWLASSSFSATVSAASSFQTNSNRFLIHALSSEGLCSNLHALRYSAEASLLTPCSSVAAARRAPGGGLLVLSLRCFPICLKIVVKQLRSTLHASRSSKCFSSSVRIDLLSFSPTVISGGALAAATVVAALALAHLFDSGDETLAEQLRAPEPDQLELLGQGNFPCEWITLLLADEAVETLDEPTSSRHRIGRTKQIQSLRHREPGGTFRRGKRVAFGQAAPRVIETTDGPAIDETGPP